MAYFLCFALGSIFTLFAMSLCRVSKTADEEWNHILKARSIGRTGGTSMSDHDIIKKYLSESEIKKQMTEETSELYKALSKWRRAHNNVPGFQVSEKEALDMVVEETADVLLCGNLLGTYAAKNVRPPVDVEAAMQNAAELLWTLQSGETAPVKTSVLMGRLLAWAEERGEADVITSMVGAHIWNKGRRWSARLQRWAGDHPESSTEEGKGGERRGRDAEMKPILFGTESVRAIMEGRKTVTRRVIKPQPVHEKGFWKVYGAGWSDNIRSVAPVYGHSLYTNAPYNPGDTLWVCEPWAPFCINKESCSNAMLGHPNYCYKATVEHDCVDDLGCKWYPSAEMPRKAARIFLRVTDVRVERLQNIQERGERSARDEGFVYDINFDAGTGKSAVGHFAEFWESTIKPKDRPIYGWEANPWVWVIGFERCAKPDDEA